jgi:hypothetical protein
MGTKPRIDKFVKAACLPEPPPVPRPSHKLSGLYLLALRTHVAHAHTLKAWRKLEIFSDPHTGEDGIPQPVNITHA